MPEARRAPVRDRSGPRSRPGGREGLSPLTGYLLVVFAAACWATGGVVAKWMFTRMGAAVDPAELSGARALLAFGLLTGFLVLRRPAALRVRARDLPFFLVFGVAGLALVHYTYFKTLSLTGVATAILLEYLAPILILVFSVAFLKERFTWTLPCAVAMSVAGCALMVGVLGGPGLIVSPAGLAWGLASAVFFSVYTVMGKHAVHRWSPWTLLAYGLGAAALFWQLILGPAAVLGVLADPGRFAAVLFMAIVSTVAPFGAYLTALRHIDATKASVTATLEPGIAAAVAFVALGESLTLSQLAGGALVLAAILVVQLPARRLAEESLPPAA